jgi:hypothetical protein
VAVETVFVEKLAGAVVVLTAFDLVDEQIQIETNSKREESFMIYSKKLTETERFCAGVLLFTL